MTKPMNQLAIQNEVYEVVDSAARESIEEINEKFDVFTVTLDVESWSDTAPYTYEYTKAGVTSEDDFEIIGFIPTNDDEDNEEIRQCLGFITYGTTSSNTITFVACSDVPTITLPIVLRKV